MGRLFGTDGIRGVAGEYPLDYPTVYSLGRQLTRLLKTRTAAPRILIGRDTRASGVWLEKILARSISDEGGQPLCAGIMTTPAISLLTRRNQHDAGIVISASHNPYRDNGIKLFAANGMKLTDAEETLLETSLADGAPPPDRDEPSPDVAELIRHDNDFFEQYCTFLSGILDGRRMEGLRIVVDCGHGAAFQAAPEVLSRLGADVVALNNQPDGYNINRDCGSLHPEEMAATAVREKADLGVAFDGDADRSILCDGRGRLVDGDHILYLLGKHRNLQGRLNRSRVVSTLMANLGLEVALEREGISLARTKVGDRYVLEEMLSSGCNLGGEQSGHIILLDDSVTGDGILTVLQILDLMKTSGKSLADLYVGFEKFPQVLLNISVRNRIPLEEIPQVRDEIGRVTGELGRSGRVVVRYSGTEPIVRIMVEGDSDERIRDYAHQIASTIQTSIG
ncbi:MAG: phosphoglucosamine mutase [Acidobacteriota bacterium]